MDKVIELFMDAEFKILKNLNTDELELRKGDFTYVVSETEEEGLSISSDGIMVYFDEAELSPGEFCIILKKNGIKVAILNNPRKQRGIWIR